jgi:reverse gyrase
MSSKKTESAKPLIIVESPAKTKTLKNFLGDEYRVEASMGHVRDLPEKEFGVDLSNGFTPKYETLPERQDVLKKLAEAAAHAPEVYLASDPDREGEAIAWHLKEALRLQNARRIEFNEITRQAVQQALQQPRDIDMNRVNAQQARRILDRIVGYKLSPLLWKKANRNTLSAGRVQSVAVRLVVEREREIEAFVPEEYWTVTARLTPDTEENAFDATLRLRDGEKLELHNEQEASAVLQELEGAQYVVQKIKRTERKRNPSPPFITSTLQQEAARKLGFSAKRTMQIAQQLYEGIELGAQGSVGLITYMRTDSIRVAAEAQQQARDYIGKEFGNRYVPEKPPQYRSRGAAQDAHEAIRPTSVARTPESVRSHLSKEQYELYRLIWQRFIASQMASGSAGCGDSRHSGGAVYLPCHWFQRQVRRLHARVCRGQRQRRTERRGASPATPDAGGAGTHLACAAARTALHRAAATLHRSHAGQGAGGKGHRQTQHLRDHSLYHCGARLCGAERQAIPSHRAGHRRDRLSGEALPRRDGRAVYRLGGAAAGRDRRRQAGVDGSAARLL